MSRFNVGDKVRKIDAPVEWEGDIIDIDWKDGACLVLDSKGLGWVRKENLVLIAAHTDPKREFLERLQFLLREFDAEIVDYAGLGIQIGDIYLTSCHENINADNIMDFDKE